MLNKIGELKDAVISVKFSIEQDDVSPCDMLDLISNLEDIYDELDSLETEIMDMKDLI